MEVITHIDKSRNLTIKTVKGKMSASEIKTAISEFWESELTLNALWDLSRASVLPITPQDVADITSHVNTYKERFEGRKGGKTAIVASDDLGYGMSRMFQTHGEGKDYPFQMEVFRTKSDALKWIGKNK
ncbi:MAG: hypothetical protein QNI95_03160 [Desulfobacterales bacterium]|nr:hypothetical protein [Desulfobacterales bacterium]